MSSSSPPKAKAYGNSSKRESTTSMRFKRASSSQSDWLGPSIQAAKAITATTQLLPFPYVGGVVGTVVVVLEAIEKVKKNRDDLKELCESTMRIINFLDEQISAHGDSAAVKLKGLCLELESFLQGALLVIGKFQDDSQTLRGRFKEFFGSSSISQEIAGCQSDIRQLCSELKFMAVVDTGFKVDDIHGKVDDIHAIVVSPNFPPKQERQTVNNCLPPSRIFSGRRSIIDKMHQYFNQDVGKQQHIYVLHGLGGAGKTQIALTFIKESASLFSDMFMIDTSTVETITNGLKNIAVSKHVGDSKQEALQWLTTNREGWLVFFDNADDPKINLNRFFPQCDHGNILITTRNPELGMYGEDSLVSDMEETEAVTLLLTRCKQEQLPKNQKTAAKIVAALGYLPLAIMQAGAFISKSGDLDGFLDIYTRNRAQLLSEKPSQSHDDYAWTVYTTWQMSFNQLSQPAAMFLQLCSFLHHTGITEDMFCNASIYKPPSIGPPRLEPSRLELKGTLEFLSHFLGANGKWDPLLFLNVTNEIKAYSLIAFDIEKKVFSIHPLVHAWCQTTFVTQECYHLIIASILGMSIVEISDHDIQLASQPLLPHVESLMKNGGEVILQHLHVYFKLQFKKIYHCSGQAMKAHSLAIEVLKESRRRFGEDHVYTVQSMSNAATSYRIVGKFKEAKTIQMMMMRKCRKFGYNYVLALKGMTDLAGTYYDLGEFRKSARLLTVVRKKYRELDDGTDRDDDHEIMVINNLATSYLALGKLKRAEELELLVLEKHTQLHGTNDPTALTIMGNLAETYLALGDLKKAEDHAVLRLEQTRKLFGEMHVHTLNAMEKLATRFGRQHRPAKANELQAKAVLDRSTQLLGDNHPDTLELLGNFAATYSVLGQSEEAQALHLVVLDKKKQVLGENHSSTLKAMRNMASVFRDLNDFSKAQELEHAALVKYKKVLGEDHHDTLLLRSDMGETYCGQGQYHKAKEIQLDVSSKCRQLLGDNHPLTLTSMFNLAYTYSKLGEFGNAQELHAVVLEKRKHTLGASHVETLMSMAELAHAHSELGDWKAAEKLRCVELEMRRNSLGEDHHSTVMAMEYLAETYWRLEQFERAETLEVVVLQKRKALVGDIHPCTLDAMHNLALTYHSLGKEKEAEELEKLIKEITID
ncbi:hypothetical protein DFH06DRAFT_603443 [Mycena polygramma]|nr:hypothetical protein DFH06DRAFT_603443 [Mycena polygramma]